ncbi:MAG: bifunctional metallophosphatase/5'-nucleotidase, partial [Oscillibacter sp.]|nr:bifunctional metallophosphatase/5'-nucleotidase [Oscillibacter sp.]
MEEKTLQIYFTSDLHAFIYPTDYRSAEERELGLFKCANRFQKDGNTLIIDG